MQFTQSPAVSEPVPNGKYQVFNGNIEGEYISLEQGKHIELRWRFKDWEVYSHVDIKLDEGEDEDECEVSVIQTDIPTHDKYLKNVHLDNLENGWRANIFERLSKVFGYALKK
ncbi:aha1 domain containing protein [Stylonychia lemnae]|uniref:Aha1 domain containing protein n=1 Tax=Stylonychia lemnae TaxID=5949 RepID=A0A077ZUV1_STYLE|nr:aha1 domain containing protein [Stylonychia lemnae]|eukprot:CDW72231.1 aha1 domain containing protein [Stylonychia lemnae]